VAERIVAKPGDDAYGRLGVLCRLAHGGEDHVRRAAAGLRAAAEGHLVGRASGAARRTPLPCDVASWSASPQAAFGQRRKMLRQSLKSLGDPQDLIGRKQAVFPWIGCGQCRDCANGDENLCVKQRFLGVSIDGGFASHVLVPDAKYLLDYDPLPVNQAATLMCSGVTAYGALKRLVDRPRQRNLLLIGLGGVGMMGLSFAQAMFKQKIAVADLSPAARESALQNGAAVAYDPSEADVVKRMIKDTEGGFDAVVDFAGNEKSMAFAVSAVARGGKIVVSGLMGGNFSLPMVQWVYKRMTIEGFMVGTLEEARELMALARAGKIKPTPMKEEPMADVQKWIEELRAGKVVGRIVLKN
jgi:D-arabinose 1-dehydrogenase-like Zn-dependent alcohol dehydrogenase